jgi:hypothetical protein
MQNEKSQLDALDKEIAVKLIGGIVDPEVFSSEPPTGPASGVPVPKVEPPLEVNVVAKDGLVVILMNKFVNNIGFTPKDARSFAERVRQISHHIDRQTKGVKGAKTRKQP